MGMSFKDCIDNAESEGVLSKDQADALRQNFGDTAAALRADFGSEADAEAARQTFAAFSAEAARRKRLKLLQAQRTGALAKLQSEFVNFKGDKDPGEFMVNIIEDVGGKAGTSTVNGRYRSVLGQAHGKMAEAIGKFERDVVGRTRNVPVLNDMVRALFGEKSGVEAGMLAKSWSDAAEFLRLRFNAAGGDIGKLEKWGLPQSHDSVAVARVKFSEWRDFVMQRIDNARMTDRDTGAAFTAQKLELTLREAYDTITTEGWSKLTPSGAANGKSLANRRADSRFLIFRDADAWLTYQNRFGNGDAFSAMMAHLDGMSRDVASMEILGPNPTASLTFLKQTALKAAKLADRENPDRTVAGIRVPQFDTVQGKARAAENMWGLFNGSTNRPVSGFAARSLVTVRDVLTSAQLGSAALSSVTDAQTQSITRKFVGLRQSNVIGGVAKLMSPGNASDRRLAVRNGLVADGAAQIGMAQARYMGELHSRGIAKWMADTTLRVSGLSPWTQGGRWAFGMEFMGTLADKSGKSLDALRAGSARDQALARSLERWKLAGAWDELRKTQLYEPESGAKFIRPEEIASRTDITPDRAQFLADRLLEMIQGETEFAVPTASLRARASLQDRAAPGTFVGEIVNSITMYKSFPTTIAYLTATRTMEQGATRAAGGGAAYAASVLFGMTIWGGIAVQMKNIASGRDPQDVKDPKFWGAALIQGGGLGIFGDFLFASESRAGGGLGETIFGPVIGFADDVRSLTVGNAQQAASGEDPRVGRDAVNFLRGNTPFGNIWYLRAAYQRAVLDNLQRMVDPDAEKYFRRKIRSRENDYGNEFFWAPGSTLPARAPALQAAIGGEVER
jgi:hypothetical protein